MGRRNRNKKFGDFSGKVEQSFKGTPEKTQFFVKGEKVATISRGRRGNKFVAEVSKSADIKFKEEEVAIRKKGITRTQETSPEAQAIIRRQAEFTRGALPETTTSTPIQPTIVKPQIQQQTTPIPKQQRDFKGAVLEAGFGRTGQRLVGVTITGGLPRVVTSPETSFSPFTPLKQRPVDVPFIEIKNRLREKGTIGKIAGEFLPTTPAGIAIGTTVVVGSLAITPLLPSAVKIGVGGTITGLQAKQALTSTLPIEKRVKAGIFATIAGTATLLEAAPFIKGAIVPKAKVQPEGFKAIQLKDQRVGIIPAGKGQAGVRIPKAPKSPLAKGAFGRPRGIEKQFLGRGQQLATSQRGIFKVGKSIKLGKGSKLKPLFVSPQEPTLKIPIARESRLGLVELFKFPKQAEIGFKIPKPQIGILKGTVAIRESSRAFALGKGTELEAIKTAGLITPTKFLGTRAIQGQAVDIFQLTLAPAGAVKGIAPIISTTSAAVTPVTTPIATSIATTQAVTSRVSAPTTIPTLPSTPPSTPPSIPSVPISTFTPTIPLSTRTSPIITPSVITTPTATPTTIPTLPSTPPSTPPSIPSVPISTFTPTTFIPLDIETPTRKEKLFTFDIPKQPKRFPVFLRRFGKFKIVGYGRTPRQAVAIGKRATTQTLGATFKVPSFKGMKVPGFRTKLTKEGILFIEPKKKRLKRGTLEIQEIQAYKRRKGKKSKRKMKGGK